tara:strand:- start:251 stop:475 length:225 start_codon:yes stop_codon:yes gene_type:complete
VVLVGQLTVLVVVVLVVLEQILAVLFQERLLAVLWHLQQELDILLVLVLVVLEVRAKKPPEVKVVTVEMLYLIV